MARPPRASGRRKSASARIFARRLGVAATWSDTRTSSANSDIGRTSGRDFGRHPQHEGQQEMQLVAQLAPVDDHVDRAFLEQELGALETLGELLAHRLLDD